MRILVFEYITGGGMRAASLPATLAREGEMMLNALVRDLLDAPGITVTLLRDNRLIDCILPVEIQPVSAEDFERVWRTCLDKVDAVWLIAPESDGVLADLCAAVQSAGKILLNSEPAAVKLTTDKWRTAKTLKAAGVSMVPTYWPGEVARDAYLSWVIKPVDGVGCQGSRWVDWQAVAELDHPISGAELLIQPYIAGQPASLSLLCRAGEAWLLSVNAQHVGRIADGFYLRGCTVNIDPARCPEALTLARRIAAAIPGLWGFVGVDLILTDQGPYMLEINPRLTTSYAGLRAALTINPAEQVLKLLEGTPVALPADIANQTVEIDVQGKEIV